MTRAPHRRPLWRLGTARLWARESRGRRSGPGEQGSAVLETLIIVPACGLAIALVVMGGRVSVAQQVVETAAADAARAGSIARTTQTSQNEARAAAARSLADQDLNCAHLAVSIDTSQVATAAGQRGVVTASITCDVALGDLAVPGVLPGSLPVTAHMTSPVDRFRSTP